MLRTEEQREARQEELRKEIQRASLEQRQVSERDQLTIKEAARELGVSVRTAYRMLDREEGVHKHVLPGRRKPLWRVERRVIERLLRRSAVA